VDRAFLISQVTGNNTLEKIQTYETVIYVKSVIDVSPPSVKTRRSLMKASEQESFRIG
jgi:hypothetical protein